MSRLKANILIGLAMVLLVAVLVAVYFSIQRYRQLESNLSGLETINKQLSLEKESLESKLVRRDTQVSDLTRERQSQDQALTELTNAIREMESKLRTQSAVLKDQVSTLQSQLTAYEKEREELVVSRQSMENKLQRTIERYLQRIKVLENQLTSQDKTVAGLAAAKKELESDLSVEIGRRDKLVSELQEQLDKNATELGASQKLHDTAIEEKRLIEDELSDKITENTLLEEQFKDLERKREAEAQFYTKTLNEYKKRLLDRDEQILDSGEHIETLEAKEHDLMKKLGTVAETIKKYEREQAATEEKIAELQNEIQRRDTQLNEANTSVTQLIDSQKELENQITQTRSAMQKEEAEKSEVWDRLLELQKNMKDRGQNLKQLHARLSETEKEKREAEESVKRMKATYTDLVAQFQTEIASKEATIDELEEKLSITFVQDILFNLGQTSISVNGRQTLEKIGTILKRNTTDKIVVMGHSDNLPITKEYQERYPTNWELSAARAAAVVRYFQHTVGIDPRQMEAVGHSFYKPVADNDTPENRVKNRRVEIYVMPAH